MPDRSAPPSTKIYDQHIPSSGYGYLTTRDGTKLAIDVRLPGGPGPYPTLVEYSGYGYADPAGAENGISPVATLLGFAVVDVNMRGTGCSGGRVQLLRAAAEPRWLRRDRDRGAPAVGAAPQGGDDRHLLRRHQPVVRGRHRSARPGGDRAAVGDRQHRDHAVSRRDPQHRLRGAVRAGARFRRRARFARPRRGLGAPADPRRRPHLPGQPGAAHRRRQRCRRDIRQPVLRPILGEPAESRHVRAQDPRPRVPRVSVDRRADRGSLPGAGRALHRHATEVVHVHQRCPHRLTRPRHGGALV